ncbi:DUF3656 domain-containing U32 family peptidase [Clostridium tetani]|uniref:DUF3656 domain-containing U32 family peptidase n=1 Tax=Clostridium tetani TaxID=1513 RepID=UPI000513DCF2|nr:U32 family peptidase [Clostridium tetani]KGI39237.1 peptidase U32 [Clostridium tetani ATCC 9441]RXM72110.1 U32 family peptidase [Clostridium tetani]SUY67319.1 protease [Clostridium tetani]
MKKVELLAPSGSIESLYAAVQSGTDAVYLGGSKFSARAYASNFDEETMRKAVDYCHIYGVKVYVTVNILLKEKELKEALEYIRYLYNIGVDALIIQDTGLFYLIKKHFPDFELHASTQMTVHNIQGAKLLQDVGFERIVLSRELSMEEIKDISNNLKVETEVFVHGALCICYSGQCLMSSLIGGRSGNRGRCAQPCRLPYTIINNENNQKQKAYLLSPKDVCTIENVEDLILSGAQSFKIEGRMKRPEYVAGVVTSYREVINSFYKKNIKEIDYKLKTKKLLKLFNREGFSKAYLYGNEGIDMIAKNFPKNTGIYIGDVDYQSNIKLKEDLTLGDGIRIKEKGFTVSKIIKNNKEVDTAYPGDLVKIYPDLYKKGDKIYKTSDIKLLKESSIYFEDPYGKKININVNIVFKKEMPITIYTHIEDELILVEGEIIQKALKKPLSREKIKENIEKTGDTPFKFESINFEVYEEGFLPISKINEVRRDFLCKIEDFLLKKYRRNVSNVEVNLNKVNEQYEYNERLPEHIVTIKTKEQLKATIENGIKNICINPFIKYNQLDISDLIKEDINIYLKIPNIIKKEYNYIYEYINNNLDNIKGIITANLGIINDFKDKKTIIGDYKLNMFNNYSLEFFKDFISMGCLSTELNKMEIKDILKKSRIPVQLLAYGRIELMVSEYCPIGSAFSEKNKSNGCNNICEKGNFSLIDRKGEEFPITTDKFCRSHILNTVPLNLIQYIKELEELGVYSFRIDFTDEDYKDVDKILKAFKNKKWKEDFKNYTRGHYKRGVE